MIKHANIKNVAYLLGLIGGAGVLYVVTDEPPERVAWINGSMNVEHDRLIADDIIGTPKLGLWCTSDTATSTKFDVLFSARAGSYDGCNFRKQAGLKLVGGGNYVEFVGDGKDPKNIFISNGMAYGHRVDFYVGLSNLGDAFTLAANWLLTQEPMTVAEVRKRLVGEPKYIDGRYVGIEAKELMPPPEPVVAHLPAIYYLLLED